MSFEFPTKPNWLSNESWATLLDKYGGSPRCETTGRTWGLSVDHILPRYQGGTDDVSNLRFLASELNSAKGPRADPYWSRHFYWDGPHDINGFRTAQRDEAYLKLDQYREWFSRPRSQISRVLYTLAWIVGSGKSLAIPALAFAYNRVVLHECGNSAPRCDRILVLTKEAAVRDQIATDIGGSTSDLVRYGICGTAPKVLIVEDGSSWSVDSFLDQHDIVVACVQQFWDKNGKQLDNLAQILAKFPLIAFDEPHYGDGQVMRIVDAAATSLCFGLTGTPIEANGDCIRQFPILSLYDYNQANINDAGLKYVATDEDALAAIIEEIGINDAEIQRGKVKNTIQTPDSDDYDKAIVPAKTVAERVVAYMEECDRLAGVTGSLAPHRPSTAIPSLWYPVHAMIVVDSKMMAEAIHDSLNTMFERDRQMYPRDRGWAANVVTTELITTTGKIKARPLTTDHPWLFAKNHGGQLFVRHRGKTIYAARIIIVVGIGREGVNNPYCGVVGVADGKSSVIEHVQRSIGRQLRAVTEKVGDQLRVPPARLDTIKIVTHKAYDIREPLVGAISFVCNMRDKLQKMQTIDDLIRGDYQLPPGGSLKTATELADRDRLAIVAHIGSDMMLGREPDVRQIVDSFRDRSVEWKQKAASWAEIVRASPGKANKDLHHDESLRVITAVLRETPNHDPSNDDLVRFVQTRHSKLLNVLDDLGNATVRSLLVELYQAHARRYHMADIPRKESLEGIRQWLSRTVKESLGSHFTGPDNVIYAFVGGAVKKALGCGDEKAANGSDWDCPQYHLMLTRPEVASGIIGYVRRKLIARGFCPAIAKALGITPDNKGRSDAE